MVTVRVFVEGGGQAKALRAGCREGFSKLLRKAGFGGRMPRIVPCGGGTNAFRDFSIAVRGGALGLFSILLVDSEEPVSKADERPDAAEPWRHWQERTKQERPRGVANDQIQLMVTCMETWIMADPAAVERKFGRRASIPLANLESRDRREIQAALERVGYQKGKTSFELLSKLDPRELERHLPHFRRFLATLEARL